MQSSTSKRRLGQTIGNWLGLLALSVFTFSPLVAVPVAQATDTNSTTVGLSGSVGPQGDIGPTGPLGPQGTVGLVGPVGPTTAPTTTDTSSPTASPAVSSPDSTVVPPTTTTESNSTTGANSDNSNTASTSSDTSITNNSTATINNTTNATADTGNNNLSQNTKVGDVGTGDIQGSVNYLNVSNSQFAPGSSAGVQSVSAPTNGSLTLTDPTARIALPSSQTNSTTGANSSNTNVSDANTSLKLITNNNATTNNNVNIDANTGKNTVSQNTEVGNVTTGNINLATSLINLINLFLPDVQVDINVWSVFGNLLGNLHLPGLSNSDTGANSTNSNTDTTNTTTGITVNQNADTKNAINVNANTGDNTLSKNSKTGNVSSGSTSLSNTETTVSNPSNPVFYLIDVFGKWLSPTGSSGSPQAVVNVAGSNSTTGANSNNSNNTTTNSNTNIAVNNNTTTNNAITINADTGHNIVTDNSVLGSFSTGSISLMNNIINFLNSFGGNIKKFTLGIVNIFGDWKGNTGPDTPTQSNSTSGSACTSSCGQNVAVTTMPEIVQSQSPASSIETPSNNSSSEIKTSSANSVSPAANPTNSSGQLITTTASHSSQSNSGSNGSDQSSSAVTPLFAGVSSKPVSSIIQSIASDMVGGNGHNSFLAQHSVALLGSLFFIIILLWIGIELWATRRQRYQAQ